MIALIFRDLRIAIRVGGGFGLSLAFFFIIVIFFPFAIGPNLELLSKVAPGTLWIGALLACLLSLERIFALDFEDGTLDLLATSPLPLEGVVMAKALVPLVNHRFAASFYITFSWDFAWFAKYQRFIFGNVVIARNAGLEHNRNIWCRFNGRNETRRAFVVTFGFASLYPNLDLWRRGRTPGNRRF